MKGGKKNMIPVTEFISALCDKDKNNISTTTIVVDCNITDLTTTETKQIVSTTLKKPIISIERHGQFLQIEFRFISSLDNDLKMLWTTLELYGKTMSDVNIENNAVPRIASGTITFLPSQFNGKYFAVAANPIFWALTSPDTGENANLVRVLVEADNFEIFENKGVDIDKIDKEIAADMAYEARQEAEAQKNKI